MMVVDMSKSLLTWKGLILGQTYMPRKRMRSVFHLWLSKLGFELIDMIICAANSHWIILLNQKNKNHTRFFIGVILSPKISKISFSYIQNTISLFMILINYHNIISLLFFKETLYRC
jgi:hypothetical protein